MDVYVLTETNCEGLRYVVCATTDKLYLRNKLMDIITEDDFIPGGYKDNDIYNLTIWTDGWQERDVLWFNTKSKGNVLQFMEGLVE